MARESDAGATAPKTTTTEAAKLGEDFVPNEPTQKSGVDAKGVPDETLGASQVERAATEALLSLRPQPSADEISKVLEGLAAVDPKTHQPEKKFKTADEAGKAAVAELNKLRSS